MKNKKETIRRFISYINNSEENGGIWLPNIQRYFVWKDEQIERLFDSIMREYPIGNLLIWRTRDEVKIRKFIDNYKDGIKLTDYYIPKNRKIKSIVLDGQQRLQSLYIALKGSYNGKELYFNVFSRHNNNKEDIVFKFKFLNSSKADPNKGWIKVKDIIYDNREYDEIADDIIKKINSNTISKIPEDKVRTVRKNILKLIREFRDKENIAYTELDSVENPEAYKIEDIVEIFIRANSGGTPLSKSDLMFSLLTADWEEIEEDLANFLEELNGSSFNFSRDFVLKTSLILIDAGAKYDVKKFRKSENLEKMKKYWSMIKKSIKEIRDFLCKYTFIRHDKALPSYLALIPLIYFNYKYHKKWKMSNKEELARWLTKVLLTGAFSGTSDTLLDALIKKINEKEDFDINTINTEIINRGRMIKISEEALLDTYYGEKYLYLIFALWYQDINFKPAYEGNLPWVDHIFPQSKLKEIKEINPETGRKVMKYKWWDRDQIANLMLLSAEENRDDKRDMAPEEWLKDKDEKYLETHLIPKNRELWKIENFEKFIEERKKLIIEKFKKMKLIA